MASGRKSPEPKRFERRHYQYAGNSILPAYLTMKNHHHNGHVQSQSGNSVAEIHEAISERAYAIWEKRGRPDNEAEATWLEAEREIVKESQE
jgi:hypothetical protein